MLAHLGALGPARGGGRGSPVKGEKADPQRRRVPEKGLSAAARPEPDLTCGLSLHDSRSQSFLLCLIIHHS